MSEEKPKQNNISDIKKHLEEIDRHISEVRQLLFIDESVSKRSNLFKSPDGKVVEGIFDGQQMISQEGEKYPVSPNYASKSQLVEGDKLKLTITPDGSFLYKQIEPIERSRATGELMVIGSKHYVKTSKKKYQVLSAPITYFKANPGDKLTIIIPKKTDSNWAAVENVIETPN